MCAQWHNQLQENEKAQLIIIIIANTYRDTYECSMPKCTNCLPSISSFNPHNLMRWVLLSNPFYRWRNQGTKSLGNCLDSRAWDHTANNDKNKIWLQAVWLSAFPLNHSAVSFSFFYSFSSFVFLSKLLKFPTYKIVNSHTYHSALEIIYSWPISFYL